MATTANSHTIQTKHRATLVAEEEPSEVAAVTAIANRVTMTAAAITIDNTLKTAGSAAERSIHVSRTTTAVMKARLSHVKEALEAAVEETSVAAVTRLSRTTMAAVETTTSVTIGETTTTRRRSNNKDHLCRATVITRHDPKTRTPVLAQREWKLLRSMTASSS